MRRPTPLLATGLLDQNAWHWPIIRASAARPNIPPARISAHGASGPFELGTTSRLAFVGSGAGPSFGGNRVVVAGAGSAPATSGLCRRRKLVFPRPPSLNGPSIVDVDSQRHG